MSNFFSKYYARLSARNDSIAVGDATTGTTLVINSDGSINVVGTGSGGSMVVTQGTVPWITASASQGSVVGRAVLAPDAAIQVAGVDSSGILQPFLTDSTGVQFNKAIQSGVWNIATLTSITNPVTVTQGTSPWLTSRNWTLASGSDSVSAVQSGSWTVTALQGTSPWVISGSVTTSPDVNIHDSSGNTLSSTGTSLNANITNTVPVSQSGSWTVQQGTPPWSVSQSGTWNIATLTSITNPVSVTQGTSPWVVSGTVTANAGTGTFLVDGSAHTQPVSGTVTANQGTSPWVISGATTVTGTVTANQGTSPWVVSGTVAATQSGTWTTGRTWTLASGTDSVSAVQSGTWNIATLTSITNPVTVNQGTSPWVVSGTVAVTQSTSPWITSRNWTLSSGTDSVASVQSGTWNIGTVTTLTSITNPVTVAQPTAANLNATVVGTGTFAVQAAQSGNWSTRLQDGSGNNITSQVNGAQRALDIGIDVAGVQIDPRTHTVNTTQPTAAGNTTQIIPSVNEYGMTMISEQQAVLAQWGKAYSATTNFVSTGTTAQTPLLLIRNPNGSGVNIKIRKITFTGAGGTFRIYSNPTITANGTAVTVVGDRQTGQTAAAGLLTTLPTASANGTVFKSFTVASQTLYVETFDFTRWIEPNNSLLITIVQSANAAPGSIDVDWIEQA